MQSVNDPEGHTTSLNIALCTNHSIHIIAIALRRAVKAVYR